jgi:hypothetical protein
MSAKIRNKNQGSRDKVQEKNKEQGTSLEILSDPSCALLLDSCALKLVPSTFYGIFFHQHLIINSRGFIDNFFTNKIY